MEIISRKEAKAKGLVRYFTGVPCTNGHIAERYTKKSMCTVCKLERNRAVAAVNPVEAKAYRQKHYSENKARYRELNARYAKEHGDALRKWRRQYYLRTREIRRAAGTEWYRNNKVKARLSSAARYSKNRSLILSQAKRRYENNPDMVRTRVQLWRKINPEKYRAQVHARRAREAKSGGKLSPDIVERLFFFQKGRCACCGKKLGRKYHLDHIMPFALGGSNTDDNVQLLTQRCNNQKHAKHPIDFMRSRGYLI